MKPQVTSTYFQLHKALRFLAIDDAMLVTQFYTYTLQKFHQFDFIEAGKCLKQENKSTLSII